MQGQHSYDSGKTQEKQSVGELGVRKKIGLQSRKTYQGRNNANKSTYQKRNVKQELLVTAGTEDCFITMLMRMNLGQQ